jgi:hypothetical protein
VTEFAADRFAILVGQIKCHACAATTHVSCLLLPGLPEGEEDDRFYPEDPARLQYITSLNPEAMDAWQHRAPYIQFMESGTAGKRYLANACEHCNALQGDWFIGEPDAPFFPTTKAGLDALHCTWVDVPLRADAEASQSSWMDKLGDQTRT